MTESRATASPIVANIKRWLPLLLFIGSLYFPAYYFSGDRYWLPLFNRYMALALFAMSVDLIWGYTGLLSLGQGLFFALGAYAVGYSLKLQKAAELAGKPLVAGPDMALPNFMEFCGMTQVPGWIGPLIHIWLALALAILVPFLVAGLFGFLSFRLRVNGIYFSLITQALVLAVYYVVVDQTPYTSGIVGMTGLAKLELFGHRFKTQDLYYLITTILVISFLACRWLMLSKFGKILTAIRDNENRVMALGYNAALFKTAIFALSGLLAGLAGALFVCAYGTTGPDSLWPAFSIEVIIMVALGGRGTLVGAILGAVLMNWANTYTNNEYKEWWPFILGGIFVVVVLFIPDGILGGARQLGRGLGRIFKTKAAAWQAVRMNSKGVNHRTIENNPDSAGRARGSSQGAIRT